MSNKKEFALQMLEKRCKNVSEMAEAINLLYKNNASTQTIKFEVAELISSLNSLFDSLLDGLNIDVSKVYDEYYGSDDDDNISNIIN